jgi:DNA-binding NtrC family response regulator
MIMAEESTQASNKLKAVCILVAEDDDAMRAFMVNTLKRGGYEVFEISDGRNLRMFLKDMALSAEKRAYPSVDLIVSDIRMPGKTALEVLSDFKRVAKEVPVVLITAFSDAKTQRKALHLGAAAVFDKPFDINDLKAVLFKLVPPGAQKK